ncbi:TetR/AcrR family transcriptional regulator [Pseudomaricurvus alkylphenolicus]|jgi:AcrR family transcriptional regulator|uniref:TetR/AcrR family transcriptional regulator n=1 Tax=Pseudomaricurvus alkylphenolicus TaxID=1306991 RepID=UPI0014226E2B|nr:TetR/AcrR family transcriptional regulator [Pseudomaricurvus alkylphenolicus]NIB41026.1 TetR/AcrR family transcriptional regulator [Pseudomaricurvus alkylphenolicus]
MGSNKKINKAEGSYHHGDLKSSLIDAAYEILNRVGADGLSLRAIAAEVGVSHMAPYAHFKNKKELFQAVIETGFDRLADAMDSKGKSCETPREQILVYGSAYLEFATGNPELYRLMLGQIQGLGLKKQAPDAASPVSKSEELIISSKRPFVLLVQAFSKIHSDPEKGKNQALGAWSLVHGIAALVIEGYIQVPEGVDMRDFLVAVTPQGL